MVELDVMKPPRACVWCAPHTRFDGVKVTLDAGQQAARHANTRFVKRLERGREIRECMGEFCRALFLV